MENKLEDLMTQLEKDVNKPKKKRISISESELYSAYLTINREKYELITEKKKSVINRIAFSEKRDPEEAKEYKRKYKSKLTIVDIASDKIKSLIKALINILKGLLKKVFSLFKKKKQTIEDAVEINVADIEKAANKATLQIGYNKNKTYDESSFPILMSSESSFNFFGYYNLAFDDKISKQILNTNNESVDDCYNMLDSIEKSVGDTTIKTSAIDINSLQAKTLDNIKTQFGCSIKVITPSEFINAVSEDKKILRIVQNNLINLGTAIDSIQKKVTTYINVLNSIEKNAEDMKPSDKYTDIQFRDKLSTVSIIFTKFNSIVTFASAFYYKINANYMSLMKESKKIILEGGK